MNFYGYVTSKMFVGLDEFFNHFLVVLLFVTTIDVATNSNTTLLVKKWNNISHSIEIYKHYLQEDSSTVVLKVFSEIVVLLHEVLDILLKEFLDTA